MGFNLDTIDDNNDLLLTPSRPQPKSTNPKSSYVRSKSAYTPSGEICVASEHGSDNKLAVGATPRNESLVDVITPFSILKRNAPNLEQLVEETVAKVASGNSSLNRAHLLLSQHKSDFMRKLVQIPQGTMQQAECEKENLETILQSYLRTKNGSDCLPAFLGSFEYFRKSQEDSNVETVQAQEINNVTHDVPIVPISTNITNFTQIEEPKKIRRMLAKKRFSILDEI